MRVSSAQLHDQSIVSIGRLNSAATETQRQVATGQRLLQAADDPAAAGRISRLDAELSQRARYVENASRAEELLAQEETVLDQIVETLQRVREITLQAGDGALSPIDRTFLGAELGVRFDELVALLNSRNADGTYLFSGLKDNGAPFSFDSNGLNYRGDGGQRELAISDGRRIAISDSGEKVFERLRSPVPSLQVSAGIAGAEPPPNRVRVTDPDRLADNVGRRFQLRFDEASTGLTMTLTDLATGLPVTGFEGVPYARTLIVSELGVELSLQEDVSAGDALLLEASGQRDLLSMVDQITTALSTEDNPTNQNGPALQRTIEDTLSGIDSAVDQIIDTQSTIGARLNSIDDIRSLNEDLILRAETSLSGLRDIDFAEAVSNLNYQAFLLEAAQQSYVRLSRVSLFNSL